MHLVFSTKRRVPLLTEELQPGLYAKFAELAREMDCECFCAGGMADHVHLALRMTTKRTTAVVVSKLKRESAQYIKAQGVAAFRWQLGYSLFSVSPAHIRDLLVYLHEQKAHHARLSFQQEMRGFYERYHLSFDEKRVWR